jgi:hypothetical protein
MNFVNTTSAPIDMVTDGQVIFGNRGISYGGRSLCMSRDPGNPAMSFRYSANSAPIEPFVPDVEAGGSYTVYAIEGGLGGGIVLRTVDNGVPSAGETTLQVFNAVTEGGPYDVYVTAANASLTNLSPTVGSVASGQLSTVVGFSSSVARQIRVTLTGNPAKTVILNIASQTYGPGQMLTLVIVPPASGQASLRGVLVANDC